MWGQLFFTYSAIYWTDTKQVNKQPNHLVFGDGYSDVGHKIF
jgi:hypothetical protein